LRGTGGKTFGKGGIRAFGPGEFRWDLGFWLQGEFSGTIEGKRKDKACHENPDRLSQTTGQIGLGVPKRGGGWVFEHAFTLGLSWVVLGEPRTALLPVAGVSRTIAEGSWSGYGGLQGSGGRPSIRALFEDRQVMKSAFWDKLIQRLDRLDPGNLQTFVERLARERGFLETLFQSIQEGIVVVDGVGSIRYSNRAAQDLVGIVPEAAQSGHPIERYLPDVGWSDILGPERPSSAGVLARELEVFYPRHRFLSFYVLPMDVASPNLDEASEVLPPMALALIIRDVTDMRRQTEDAIQRESLSALTLLSAGVAHELGNPLNSLNIHLQLMRRELADVPEANRADLEDLVQVAIDNVRRLDQIISRFLKAVRPTAPQLQESHIAVIIGEVLEFLSRELHDRGIVIEQAIDPEVPRMMLDSDQIKQALFNLVRNALQAMPHGGRLGIRLQWDEARSRVVLGISDNGTGIPKDHMSRLFDPYWTSKPEGTGLGLMIVHRIVTEHGGEIEVHSVEGQGTEFRIFLPTQIVRMRMLKSGVRESNGLGNSEGNPSEGALDDQS